MPKAAVDRRRETAIDELQLGVVDLRLVAFERALVLSNRLLLIVQLLLRDRIADQYAAAYRSRSMRASLSTASSC